MVVGILQALMLIFAASKYLKKHAESADDSPENLSIASKVRLNL